jgi:hypothetical protein
MKLTSILIAGLTGTCLVVAGLSATAHAGDRYTVGKSQPSAQVQPGGAFSFSESLSAGTGGFGSRQPHAQKLQQHPSTSKSSDSLLLIPSIKGEPRDSTAQ